MANRRKGALPQSPVMQGRACPRCRVSGFTSRPSPPPGDGRPTFTCQGCGHEWQHGPDGGLWRGKEQGPTTLH